MVHIPAAGLASTLALATQVRTPAALVVATARQWLVLKLTVYSKAACSGQRAPGIAESASGGAHACATWPHEPVCIAGAGCFEGECRAAT